MSVQAVPLLDLNRQYAPIENDVLSAIEDVVKRKQFILGETVTTFESELSDYTGSPYVIGVSSGTDALILALMALGIGVGDEVITSPFTFFATGGSIHRVGATPVFVDIDPVTLNIDPSKIEAAITKKTKAIMPVHIFGQVADMASIMPIATQHNLVVIEDAAQAIGAKTTIDGELKQAGTIGDVGCFSFFPSKNLGAMGDGGFVSTNDMELAERMTCLRVHGGKNRYYHEEVGGNFRLDAMQAAILRVKLPHLNYQHEARRKNAAYYNEHLPDHIKTPTELDGNYMIYNQYTIQSDTRDELIKTLSEANIGHAVYYPLPLHLQECFAYLGGKKGDCPEAERASNEVVSLPVFAELREEELRRVCGVIDK